MTESMQILVDLLTAAAALGAFGVGLWNAYQFGEALRESRHAGDGP